MSDWDEELQMFAEAPDLATLLQDVAEELQSLQTRLDNLGAWGGPHDDIAFPDLMSRLKAMQALLEVQPIDMNDDDQSALTLLLPDTDSTLLSTLTDKRGCSYEVRGYGDPEWYQLTIRAERGCVGYVNLSWLNPPVMELRDIKLEPPYRNRGIGTALLRVIDEIARGNQLTSIEGSVMQSDARETRYLLDWYERNGFSVVRQSPGGRVAAHISRPVPSLEREPT